MQYKNEKFFLGDVSKICGINQGLLKQWLARKLIKPSTPSPGTGYRNIFTIEDLCRISLFKVLIDSFKFPREAAAQVAFIPKNTALQRTIEITINEFERVHSDFRQGRDEDLPQPLDPEPVYLAVWKKENWEEGAELKGRLIFSEEKFKMLYDDREMKASFHVVNITQIVRDLFKRVVEVKG